MDLFQVDDDGCLFISPALEDCLLHFQDAPDNLIQVFLGKK